MVITYRSPPTSSGISRMLFFHLDDRQAAMPGLENVFNLKQSSSRAALVRAGARNLLCCFFTLCLQNEVFTVTKAFYSSYYVTLLPVMCLDMPAHHLVAVSIDAGYKRRKFHFQHQLSPDGRQVSISLLFTYRSPSLRDIVPESL